MTIRAPFQPIRGANRSVTPNSTSTSVSIDAASKTVRIVNAGLNICHVRVGIAPQVATTSDMPVLPNSQVFVQKGDGEDTVAYISALGTTLHIQPGEGGH